MECDGELGVGHHGFEELVTGAFAECGDADLLHHFPILLAFAMTPRQEGWQTAVVNFTILSRSGNFADVQQSQAKFKHPVIDFRITGGRHRITYRG